MLNFRIAVTLLFCTCNGAPELTLFNTADLNSASYIVKTKFASSNETCLPTASRASGICVNSGIWILYPESNYLGHPTLYSTGEEGPQICVELPENLRKKLGSYRPVGDSTGPPCSLNIYKELNYEGQEWMLTEDTDVLDDYYFKSVIRSGPCEWEFFQLPEYNGFSECLRGETNDSYFLPDIWNGSEDVIIGSVKRSCDKPIHKMESR